MTLLATESRQQQAAVPCVTCGATSHGRYCHACGERLLDADEFRVRRFLARSLPAAFEVDSKLYRTLKAPSCC